ncbi:KAT8 regulatory NSL complex subunit dim gamma-tubulin 1 isoform X2 [Oratosquilla oratoria]|uniref:KAT8 regulatory NSL complex subunit dim gamma-tubulin 1 isoform X2 n=1 Tax=Oratosquilla oratoria TaxID=337810 RepID=UPI003F7699CD
MCLSDVTTLKCDKMSSRSNRVVKTVRTLSRPVQDIATCGYSNYSCSQPCLENFDYCARHILEDKSAPYKQCNYIYSNNGKRCTRPAPKTDKKEGYCLDHSRKSLLLRQRAVRKRRSRETPETLLAELGHHKMDSTSAGQNAIPDPASVVSSTAANLDYASDSDSDAADPIDALWRSEADSEVESAGSDEDPLEHAQIYTTEEIAKIYLEKIQRLKSLYIGEYRRLAHILKENRRKYLHAVKAEKETMMSIHAQPKESVEERASYEKLKMMFRYHKHLGKDAILHRQYFEKRLQVTEGLHYKPGPSVGCVKCIYSEGSWKCGEKSIPLSKYCSKHILHDSNQVLYRACGVEKSGDDECSTPIIGLPFVAACVYHTPVPDPLPVSAPVTTVSLANTAQGEIDITSQHMDLSSAGQDTYIDVTGTGEPPVSLTDGGSLMPPEGEIIDISSSQGLILTQVPDDAMQDAGASA